MENWYDNINLDVGVDIDLEAQIENILGLEDDYNLNIELIQSQITPTANNIDGNDTKLGKEEDNTKIKDYASKQKHSKPTKKKSSTIDGSCRCGNFSDVPGNLTCIGQKCFCYKGRLPCVDCVCLGCRNPFGVSKNNDVKEQEVPFIEIEDNESVVESSWNMFQSVISPNYFEDTKESAINSAIITTVKTIPEEPKPSKTVKSPRTTETYDYCEFQDTTFTDSSESIQPTHLQMEKPTNSELWSMRKINESTLAGYNPFRGDFEVEFENDAEQMVSLASKLSNYNDVNFKSSKDECKLIRQLQAALVESYNSSLQQRKKRKDVIKEHGLMNQRGTYIWYSKLEVSLGKSNLKKLIRFTQLSTQDEAQMLYASLEYLYEKRAQLNKLIFYRTQHGIATKTSMDIFESERKKRESDRVRVDVRNLAMPTVNKRKRAVQIFHLPKYKELSPEEADLCSVIGLVPIFFLDTRDVLIADCKKHNGLLLKRARKLVKIDVNKTRKIFDLLMEQGVIWPPVDESLSTMQST